MSLARTMERRFSDRSGYGFSAFDYHSGTWRSLRHDLDFLVGEILQFAGRETPCPATPHLLFFTCLPNHPAMSVATFETSVSCREENVLVHASSLTPNGVSPAPMRANKDCHNRHCAIAINELNWTIEESNRKGTNQHAGTLGDGKRFFSTLIIELKNLWDKLDRMMCRLGQI